MRFVVGRRSIRVEGFSRECLDQIEMRILVRVGSEYCENQYHRKGKGFLAMQISQELVSPNPYHNMFMGKGKEVNIPLLLKYVRQRKLFF